MEHVHPIRAYREARKLSAAEFARQIGVKRNTVWRWEAGRQQIDRSLWAKLHEATGIPLEQLAGISTGEAA